MGRVLNDISVIAPEWLLTQVSRDWFDRYGPRFDAYRLPKEKGEQEDLQDTIGADGWHLLTAIYQEDVLLDSNWQARAGQGYDGASFVINWEEQQAVCLQGKTSAVWREIRDKHQQERVQIRFATEDCRTCGQRPQCTKSVAAPRTITLYPQPIYEVMQSARQRQETNEFKKRYRKRAGVEGTISQGTRSFGLRRARYIGLAKTHLQNAAAAAAMNLTRMVSWLNETPKGKTRQSRFMALAPTT